MQNSEQGQTQAPSPEAMEKQVIAMEDGRKLYSYRFTAPAPANKEQTP
jgi:hypothetical protein